MKNAVVTSIGTIKMPEIYIRDDQGRPWYFDGSYMRCVTDDWGEYGGYACSSLEDGVRLMNEYGIITGGEDVV